MMDSLTAKNKNKIKYCAPVGSRTEGGPGKLVVETSFNHHHLPPEREKKYSREPIVVSHCFIS